MRLFRTYKYYFSKSRLSSQFNAFDVVEKYIQENALKYDNFLYKFYLYYTKKKNTDFFESHKILGDVVDIQEEYCNKCYLSNVGYGTWNQNNKRIISFEDMKQVFCDVKQTNVGVKLAFNNINWNEIIGGQPLVIDDSNAYVLPQVTTPLNNNICICDNTYDKKTEIYLTFEFMEGTDNAKYLQSADKIFGVSSCESFLWQVFTKEEKDENKQKKSKIEKLIKTFEKENTISLVTGQEECLKSISLARALKAKKLSYVYGNGFYELIEVDNHNNKIEIGFDYIDRLLVSYINYVGAEFHYHICFNEIRIQTQNDIENYLEQLLALKIKAERELLPKIRNFYAGTPKGLF